MVIDDRKAQDDLADAAFGRMLLDSAKADGVSNEAVQRAWSSFARATGSVAAISLAGHAVWSRILRSAGARWMVVGALGGGALGAVWMKGHLATTSTSAPLVVVPVTPQPAQAPLDEARNVGAAPNAPPLPFELPSDRTPKITRDVRHHRPVAGPPEPAPPAVSDSVRPARASTLPAEVVTLDAARVSLAARDYEKALRVVADYHGKFREGQLAADADVIAIEALEAKGDHAEAVRRGSRFLAEHPNDPHAARIGSICAPQFRGSRQ